MNDSDWRCLWLVFTFLAVSGIALLVYALSNCEVVGPPVLGPKGGYSSQCVIRK